MRAPESSALGTNPRAPERATSGPKSDESRLDTSTMSGPLPLVSRPATSKPSMSGSWTSRRTRWAEPLGLGDARRSVSSFADDVEPLGLEQHASARTKGRVVVDDEDGQSHREAIVNADNTIPIRLATPPPRPRSRGTRRRDPARRRRPSRPRTRRAGLRARAGGAGVDPAVDLEGRSRADQRPQALDLAGAGGDERLAAPARVDRHAECESRSAATSASTRTGVPGQIATPAVQPASLIAPIA